MLELERPLRSIEFERFDTDVKVYLNGKEIGNNEKAGRNTYIRYTRPYRFYCDFAEGENEIRVVATLYDTRNTPFSGYVKIGKQLRTPWHVNLHYGKARVFVKSNKPELLEARLCSEKH